MNRVVAVVVAGAIALLLALTGVLDAPHATLLAACVAGIALAWPGVLPAPPALPDLPYHTHPGGRRDLSDLSWSALERDGTVSAKVLTRVESLATSAGATALAHRIATTRSATPAQVLDWLDQIDASNGES